MVLPQRTLSPSTTLSCLDGSLSYVARPLFSPSCMDPACRNTFAPESCSYRDSHETSSAGHTFLQTRRAHSRLCTPFLPRSDLCRDLSFDALRRNYGGRRVHPLARYRGTQVPGLLVRAALGEDLSGSFSRGSDSVGVLVDSLSHLSSAIQLRMGTGGAAVSEKAEQAEQFMSRFRELVGKAALDFVQATEGALSASGVSMDNLSSDSIQRLAALADVNLKAAEAIAGKVWASLLVGPMAMAVALENESLRVVEGTGLLGVANAMPSGLTSILGGGVQGRVVMLATVVLVAAVAVAATVRSSLADSGDESGGEDLPLRYEPDAIARYFRKRPAEVLVRSAKILGESSVLAASIMIDRQTGRLQQNEALRAQQLRELITRLGPTAIKAGQALSIRPDLLSAAYLEELQKLQDRVPSFSNEEARQLILEGLGAPTDDIFSEFTPEPVAAASLGQVYKGRLREGGEVVAVKVQRPGVVEGISCDLFVLRIAAQALMRWPTVKSDLVAVLDAWARRFFDELDYVQEARNAVRFTEDMRELPNITIAQPYLDYTSRKVLTTAWVEGEKLSESTASDVGPLVNSMLACYLTQLLESGFLHADPHPGNLLRTPDGKLCVLDFGLMTEVTEDQRYALIDYIAHLVNADFDRVADDLVRLGFVPEDSVNPEKTAAVTPALTRVLTQLAQGGGARKLNIQEVTEDLSKMSSEYTFVIPPYFALILRAFGVLEGIGLEADPDYAIVDECYPYLAKRLLTDDSPRARAALRYLLYGTKAQLDVERVETLAASFQKFQQVTAPVASTELSTEREGTRRPRPQSAGVDPAAKQALLLLFAPEGSFIQELLLTEMVRAVDALSREALAELWGFFVRRRVLPLPAPLRALAEEDAWPLLPGLLLLQTRGLRMGRLSNADRQALSSVRRLWALLEPHLNQPSSAAQLAGMARDTMPLWGEMLPGVTTAAQRFVAMLLQRQVLRFADDLDGQASVARWERDPFAIARQIGPSRRLPSADRKSKDGGEQKMLQAR